MLLIAGEHGAEVSLQALGEGWIAAVDVVQDLIPERAIGPAEHLDHAAETIKWNAFFFHALPFLSMPS
jgi:hypothetical protein